ncbi:MAG: DEAD/DEAH box helicase family protein [Candidatus Thermoplasmatota archaeon]
MTLKNLCNKMKGFYDSDDDNILHDFFIPVLSESKKYERLAGFFSSKSLAVSAKGIKNFINNGGRMNIIASACISDKDIEAISKAEILPEELIEKRSLEELENINEDFVRDHVRALGWMVANDKLQIRIAFPVSGEGDPLKTDQMKDGIFHPKIGIFTDEEENKISFNGSDNETAKAWVGNVEMFDIFCSWNSNEAKRVRNHENAFKKYWDGRANRTEIFRVNEVESKLKELAPGNIEELNLNKWYKSKGKNSKKPKHKWTREDLFDHQKDAIEAWEKNNYKILWNMATGTGKTIAALFAAKKLLNNGDNLLILVPTKDLINQWKEDIEDFFPSADLLICSSDTSWKSYISDFLKVKKEYPRIILSTLANPTSSQRFKEVILKEDFLKPEKTFIIVDEVHRSASPKRRKNIKKIPAKKARIGMSATPKRKWDEGGNKFLYDYFTDEPFRYTLEDAIKDGILSKYEYYPIFVNLTEEELNDYEEITSSINNIFYKALNLLDVNPEEIEMWEAIEFLKAEGSEEAKKLAKSLEKKFNERRNIVKRADNKYEKLREVIDKNEDEFEKCIVFCPPKSDYLDRAYKTLLDKSPLKIHGNMNKRLRKETLDDFKKGKTDYLLAMKVLDEGIDVPKCDAAIILSSSKNERQFVQRRGRILRSYSGKEIAKIYDIVVIPKEVENMSSEEKKILKDEIKRVNYFLKSAYNKDEVKEEIKNLKSRI